MLSLTCHGIWVKIGSGLGMVFEGMLGEVCAGMGVCMCKRVRLLTVACVVLIDPLGESHEEVSQQCQREWERLGKIV